MSNIPNRYLNQQYQPNVGAPAPSNMSSQRFCLRWNNHQSNLLSVFDQLLHDESFVDVTLAVEGQLLRAHKMVLSACSPYFQALFVNHPDKHPIVILKDVPYSDMKSLLDFMYRGEVSVDQDRLTAFLRVAESLRIKGLTEVNEEKCDIPSITSSLMQNPHHQQNTSLNPPPHLHRIQHSHKRFGHMLNPLLGSALMQPKRKRGRPRKLSGSSNGTPGAMGSPAEDFDNRVSGDMLVQGSPEMLEVKMGMDGFGAGGNTSDSSTGGRPDVREQDDEPKIKEEEPIASTSKDQETKSQDEFTTGGGGNEDAVTVRLVMPMPLRLQETTVIMSSQSATEARTVPVIQSVAAESAAAPAEHEPGIHFLTDDQNNSLVIARADEPDGGGVFEPDGGGGGPGTGGTVRSKSELLEYLIRDDGSVTCKLCGEVLASRTHWYRHKYKLHVPTVSANTVPPVTAPTTVVTVTPASITVASATTPSASGMSPSPLFRCTHCNVFFKSRKGYMGHVSARHPNDGEEEVVVAADTLASDATTTTASGSEGPVSKTPRRKESCTRGADWEQQREKEEKLVADIIDRVRKECEAQGAAVSRRGYSRRSTVMNTCN